MANAKLLNNNREKDLNLIIGPYHISVYDIQQLNNADRRRIETACAKVEQQCWNPVDNFADYFAKNNVVATISVQGKIVGFLLASHWKIEQTVVCSLEEMMILDQYRGQSLWRRLTTLVNHFIARKFEHCNDTSQFCNIINTCNPAVMMMAKKACQSYLASSFKPNNLVHQIATQYVKTHRLTPLSSDKNCFCLKKSFPGCSKIAFSNRLRSVKKLLPQQFQFERGDSLLALGLRQLTEELVLSNQLMNSVVT